MRASRLAPPALLLLVALVVALMAACSRPAPAPPDLEITRWRYHLADGREVVRVVGEIVNRGSTTVPQVEVQAVLLSTQGLPRGDNMTVLGNLRPGERRSFSLGVTSHGGVSRVELSWSLPQSD